MQGLLGCCSARWNTAFHEELLLKSNSEAQAPRPPLPPLGSLDLSSLGWDSAREGYDRADRAPRAAANVPPELLVDQPPTSRGGTTARGATSALDPAARAAERSRLKELVNEFVREASLAGGCPCELVVLDSSAAGDTAAPGLRRLAWYGLQSDAEQLRIHSKAPGGNGQDGSAEYELVGSWSLRSVVGCHRAEDSALCLRLAAELDAAGVAKEALATAAVLEFGGSAGPPLLLIEESSSRRERLVAGLQVLRHYRGAARRPDAAGKPTPTPPQPPGASAAQAHTRPGGRAKGAGALGSASAAAAAPLVPRAGLGAVRPVDGARAGGRNSRLTFPGPPRLGAAVMGDEGPPAERAR